MMPIYSDQSIDYWGEYFQSHDLHSSHGLRFETFLANPGYHIERSKDIQPLLKPQRLIKQRLDAIDDLDDIDNILDDGIEMRGNQNIKRIHPRFPTANWKKNTNRRRNA